MGSCCTGMCYQCEGIKWTLVGLLVLLNGFLGLIDWWVFIGVLVTLKGVMKMVKPMCPHCEMDKAKVGNGSSKVMVKSSKRK